MGAGAPTAWLAFQADLESALQLAGQANTSKHRNAQASTFGHWITFCHKQGVTSTLTEHLGNPELRCSYLLVYAVRYRREGRKDKPVVADAVAKALTAIGQGIARMGQPDPRFDPRTAKLHSLHTDFLSKLREDDDPPSRAHPVNMAIIHSLRDVIDTEHAVCGRLNAHVIDLIVVAFCCLL